MARRWYTAVAAFALVISTFATGALSASAAPTELFFSEYIEGSSNNKALEIYNGTTAPVDLGAGGYNVQVYFNGSTTAGLTINLTGTVAAGDVYVLAQSLASAPILAVADQTNGSGWFNGDDAVVLRRGTTIIDAIGQIGVDPGSEWGTGLASTADNTLRRKATISAGDTNAFDAFDPSAQWDGFAQDTFDGLGAHALGDNAPSVISTDPANGAVGVPLDANIAITFSEPVSVSGSWFTVQCTSSGTHAATVSGGPVTFTLDPGSDFVIGEDCSVTVIATAVRDIDVQDPPDAMVGNFRFTVSTPGLPALIHEIQGAGHTSPLVGRTVSAVPGIVTFVASNGFFFQDTAPDADPATSEGVFVFGSTAARLVHAGDLVRVGGKVAEFGSGTNLTTTEITSPTVTIVSSGNPLPPATTLAGPREVIEDDATGNVLTSGIFDPLQDGIDYYESLEGMLVEVDDAVATGPTHSFTSSQTSEVPVVDAHAGVRTSRGGIVIQAGDLNPERIIIQTPIDQMSGVNVGDSFGSVVGVMDYNFGNFKLRPLGPVSVSAGGLAKEITATAGTDQLAVATFNVENLDPSDGAAKFDELAAILVTNLASPDLVALEEVQDNNGAVNDGTVAANVTLDTLVAAIAHAGGPAYEYRLIDPVDGADGGEPGGNIRVAFLFRTDRGLAFVDRPGAGSLTPNTVVGTGAATRLQYSPGRIDPTNTTAFHDSRKPLAAEFTYNGHRLFAIANHWNSKNGDQPLFGRFQPPVLSSETQRRVQAQVVRDFVATLLAADPFANIVAMGDLNDFQFSEPLNILKSAGLKALIETLPVPERYTYDFDGNAQAIDHILLAGNLFDHSSFDYDVVHVNSEFAVQASDHDPQVVRLRLAPPTVGTSRAPVANANGWNNTDVVVSFDCTTGDPLHAIVTCPAPVTVSAEAKDQMVTASVETKGGASFDVSVFPISIDKTAPVPSWTGNAGTYSIAQTVAIDCSFGADLSGIDPAATYLCDSANGPAYTFHLGTNTLSATATDRAGNTGGGATTFIVTADGASLCTVTKSLVDGAGLAGSLCAKLDASAAAAARGNTRAHDNQIQAYINEVNAQRGKAMSDADANTLIALAGRI